MRYLFPFLLLALTACAAPAPPSVTKANAFDPLRLERLPDMRVFAPKTGTPPSRSNTEIAADFMELEFALESGRALSMLTRFEGEIGVALQGDVPTTAPADLALLLARMRNEAGLQISQTAPTKANVIVEFLPRKRLQALAPTAACFVVPRVTSWAEYRKRRNSEALAWTNQTRRDRVAIFIPSDTGPQEVRDCLHEELAQAIGPLNDLYRLPDTVFNDDNFQAVLTGFDMLILRLHYSPELHNGMASQDVAARLPAILAAQNPSGNYGADAIPRATSRQWIESIETVLGPKTADGARVTAAERALEMAISEGWTDNRLAFSYFAVGRMNLGKDGARAVASFTKAAQLYRGLDDGGVHAAHVDMQMAAFALSSGQPDIAISIADTSIDNAFRAQNAALLATLMLLKAEALDQLGRDDAARAVRLDSLGWARYGFGSDQDVRRRIADIAALSPT